MNRCTSLIRIFQLPTLAALCACVAFMSATDARAQETGALNEAAAGGRNFPEGTLRGSFLMVEAPEIQLDGHADRLSPGARIRSPRNMLLMPATLIGQKLLVNYTRDASNLVSQVWVLTPDEARVARTSAARPSSGLSDLWPFAVSAGPRDDGRTPFDQLPKFGE